MKEGAGRPTDLTEELIDKIKQSILDGNDLKTTASIIGKSEDVMYQWNSKNYSGIADKIENWKRDRKLILAERNIEEILEMETTNYAKNKLGDLVEVNDTQILKVKADMSKFVSETLGKDKYSKRNELSGVDGKDLIPKPLLNAVQDNIGHSQNTETKEED